VRFGPARRRPWCRCFDYHGDRSVLRGALGAVDELL